ncbi:hypothetical protein LPJ70_001270, partial [Coemansia sp. RSA 2708]
MADSFRIAEPTFAEWGYYNVDYAALASQPLAACACSDGMGRCLACEDMVLACQRELEKVSTFLHLKGGETEHTIQACEHHVQALAQLAGGEQLVRLGQLEEAIGAALAQAAALARFRRSNFSGLWRQMRRMRDHCAGHFGELAELAAASSLFGEAALETHQLARASQVFAAIQGCHAGAPPPPPLPFPALARWRGWVHPARVRTVLRLLRRHLPDAGSDGPAHTSLPAPCPSPPDSCPSSAHTSAHTSPARAPRCRTRLTAHLDTPALARYHAALQAENARCSAFSLAWAPGGPVTLSHDTLHGPWLADRQRAAAVSLLPHQVLPFLQSELNLSRLPPDCGAAPRQRETQRCAQNIQRQIILDGLRPLVLASEDRSEFADAHGLRVAVRSHIAFAYTDGRDGWLQDALCGALDPAAAEHLPFALIDVHLRPGQPQMPGWLAHLFFDSALVHPVLDFDLYLHAVATLRPGLVATLPYWMVDAHRAPFAAACDPPPL